MFKRVVVAVVTLTAVGVGAYVASPALRAKVHRQWAQVSGWTEDARRADPVGFATYAERKLKRDLEVMERTRRELAAEVGQLSRKIRQEQALADQAVTLAGDFRTQYQEASAGGGFPIEVRNAAYTQPQAKSQVSMLLAEAEGYQESVARLTKVQREAESQMEALAVRVTATESQLAALSAKREMLRARQLTAEGQQLLAQVDELMTGNAQLIEGNPVRTVRELMDSPSEKPDTPVKMRRVEEFLAQTPELDAEQAATPLVEETVAQKPKARPASARKPKPIFQQN